MAPLDVDKEQVRMLVLELGPREAARRCNLSEATVLQWSKRGKWLAHTRQQPPKLPVSMQPHHVIGVIKPVDALANTLLEDGKATRVAAMRYSRRTIEAAAREADSKPLKALERAPLVKAAIQGAALAGDWQANASDNGVHLSFFQINQAGEVPVERPVIDVEQA